MLASMMGFKEHECYAFTINLGNLRKATNPLNLANDTEFTSNLNLQIKSAYLHMSCKQICS